MEICQIAQSASQGLGFSNFTSIRIHHISAGLNPVDVLASPRARSNVRTAPRKQIKKVRRTKLKSGGSDYPDYIEETGFFGDGGVGDGPFGNGGGGGGGGDGWRFGRDEGWNWDDSASPSWSDPAFDFVYQIMSWAVLSNCVHFAFKRVLKIGDNEREKVAVRFTPVC